RIEETGAIAIRQDLDAEEDAEVAAYPEFDGLAPPKMFFRLPLGSLADHAPLEELSDDLGDGRFVKAETFGHIDPWDSFAFPNQAENSAKVRILGDGIG